MLGNRVLVGRRCQSSSALVALTVLALLAVSGCQGPQKRIVGTSVEGRPIECQAFDRGDDVVLIMATIHGDEPAGTPLVQRLAEYLTGHPRLTDGKQVLLMPLANPDGFAHGTRHNVRGIDLNRNFPAGNFIATDEHGAKPLSEPESRAIKAVLDEWRPNRIVSIHQPYGVIDYDGPAEELARAMAARTDLPVKRVGSLPGSLGSYAGLTLGIPIITLELPESAGDLDDDALWESYGEALLEAIRFPDTEFDQ